MSNDELRFDIEQERFWEPRVDNEAIAVSTDEGDVTLRGTVGSNELSVRLLDGDTRDDADVRDTVLQALMLDAAVPSSIDASVKHGTVVRAVEDQIVIGY